MRTLPTIFFEKPYEATTTMNKLNLHELMAYTYGSMSAWDGSAWVIKSECIKEGRVGTYDREKQGVYKVWLERNHDIM